MRITFHGAARTVTGSQHLIEVNERQILLDCGLYQGKRQDAYERNRKLPFEASRVDVLVLSHAHIDHSGNIPNLVKSGFDGDIFTTFASRDLCGAMLMDSAHIQEKDVEYANKKRARKGEAPVEPIYTQPDAARALSNFHAIGYDRSVKILPGVTLKFVDAGHMLGSSIVILSIEDREASRDVTLVFSGDLGQPGLPILRDPTKIDNADVLIMESTYGDKLHESLQDSEKRLQQIVIDTYKRGGKVIIPAFAVGRTQEIVYALHKLSISRKIPHLPIFVDSPLAVNVTEIFANHPECYDEETREFMRGERGVDRDPFGFQGLTYTRSVEDSKELNFLREPAVIISASGMAESGRIQHHLINNIEDPRNTILIAGFQAEHTLGRRIEEKQDTVNIFGESYRLRAQVEKISGFSAHADRKALLDWAGSYKKKPVRTFLVHGEDAPLNALAEGLKKETGFERVEIPDLHQSFVV
ncbi:MAG: MBL fold metallo-hydrolase [Anaerolineae bacterium]|nr:MBL fold metallo-hydrolase [Anaerolineae bacterium]